MQVLVFTKPVIWLVNHQCPEAGLVSLDPASRVGHIRSIDILGHITKCFMSLYDCRDIRSMSCMQASQ